MSRVGAQVSLDVDGRRQNAEAVRLEPLDYQRAHLRGLGHVLDRLALCFAFVLQEFADGLHECLRDAGRSALAPTVSRVYDSRFDASVRIRQLVLIPDSVPDYGLPVTPRPGWRTRFCRRPSSRTRAWSRRTVQIRVEVVDEPYDHVLILVVPQGDLVVLLADPVGDRLESIVFRSAASRRRCPCRGSRSSSFGVWSIRSSPMNWRSPAESSLYIRTFPAGSGTPSPASSEFSNSSSTRTSPVPGVVELEDLLDVDVRAREERQLLDLAVGHGGRRVQLVEVVLEERLLLEGRGALRHRLELHFHAARHVGARLLRAVHVAGHEVQLRVLVGRARAVVDRHPRGQVDGLVRGVDRLRRTPRAS